MVSELNQKFGIDETIVFAAGEQGLPKAILRAGNGSELEVYLFGATISSWRHPNFNEVLYMSPKADFSGTKPLRGGIPLVFPQFSSGKLPSHGFARTSNWSVKSTELKSNGEVVLTLELRPDRTISAMWPHEFITEFEIKVGAELITKFSVENSGPQEFSFQNALHTYFSISDIHHAQINGLNRLTYLDNLNQRARGTESRAVIHIDSEIDRVYLSAPDKVVLEDLLGERVITIRKSGMKDAVVWNPWIERCKAIGDLEPESYKNFLCVESGNIAEPVKLGAGETFSCSQVIGVE